MAVGVAEGESNVFHAVVADDDTVYAASSGALDENSVIAAYKASDGAPLWRSEWPKSYLDPALECQLALGGGNLYIADHINSALIALDTKTGEALWQFHDPAKSTSDNPWQVVADDHYVIIGYDTPVHGFKAA